jgi:hypothetical protein
MEQYTTKGGGNMADVNLENAVHLLRDRLGARYKGPEETGRDDMVHALQSGLGYSHKEARETVDALVASGTLRYQRDSTGEVPNPVVPVAAGTGGSTSGIASGGVDYWKIGEDTDESSGRTGQVQPA